jgi:chromosome segregation protein
MKFNKLRLLGFKSFVEPSEFVIERGLTGIVGPNGCGKSNLVEAMRWVMGENSYKNMRASGMDDVIFSGSGNRPARNTAEVALFLDNSDRTAPAAFNDQDEVHVSRRIERESGSAYRINGKDARAKDVQLLFADASTGARSPSMVGQGRIGELIQAKPQARRQLLEEAAGISGLYSRRHEAELRLRAAENNLERLEDVTGQLDSQIESLKRQSRQANRFKSISADIRKSEATLLHIRWQQAKKTEAQSQSDLSEATKKVAEMAAKQSEAARNQAVEAHKLPELRDAEAKAAAALQRLQISKTQLEEEAKRLERRKNELDQRLMQFGADIDREKQMVADNAEILARLNTEEAELSELLANSDAHAAKLKQAFETAGAALSASETALTAVTSERAEAAASKSQLERRNSELSDRKARIERQMTDHRAELVGIESQIAGLPDPQVKQNELEQAEVNAETAGKASSTAEIALEEARQAEGQSRQPVTDANAHLNEIETEARTIRKILNAGSETGLFPPIVDKLDVERGFETALGAAIGDDLDLPMDANAPAFWQEIDGPDINQKLPEGIKPLSAFVKAPKALARRLSQVGVADTDAQGERLQSQLLPGQRLVTIEGALWRWDGYVASADAPTPAAMRLAQKNRLAELDREAVEATKALRKVEESLEAAKVKVTTAQQDLQTKREAIRTTADIVIRARQSLKEAQDASGALSNRAAVLREAEHQFVAQLDEVKAALVEVEAALLAAPDLSQLEKNFNDTSTKVATDRGALAEARAAHEGMERENRSRQQRIDSIKIERENWTLRAKNAESQISSLKERSSVAEEEAKTLADAPDNMSQRRIQLMNQLTEAESLRKEAADILAIAESKSKEADRLATEAISDLSTTREARGRTEERTVAAKERRLESEARIREALNCEPHEAMKLAQIEGDENNLDPDKIERSLERLKVERERLGAVNLRAEEEQKELSEQLNTIVSEREDVIEAIRKLRSAIQSLNKEGRERLLAAFDVVNEQFKRLFTHLFGGGTAELQLVESDDPLEAGLEILARPPGKKPQTMTLLSGGEQALTAMALIFAVFLTNPAPICVLDEVDAPLDDHNVERFCNLMDEMASSTETRFVLITHNPITMSRMNRLFGVTMAEQGVSQLVSVDLQTAEGMRDAG